jgi:hypothetical protein
MVIPTRRVGFTYQVPVSRKLLFPGFGSIFIVLFVTVTAAPVSVYFAVILRLLTTRSLSEYSSSIAVSRWYQKNYSNLAQISQVHMQYRFMDFHLEYSDRLLVAPGMLFTRTSKALFVCLG